MAERLVSLSGVVLLLGVMGGGIASGAEIVIENRAGIGSGNGCNPARDTDTSIIRLKIQGNDKLPPRPDTTDGHVPNYPSGDYSDIPSESDSTTFNVTATTYRLVIEMGSWNAGGSGGFVQRRYTHDNKTDGCDQGRYRYLDFTVMDQATDILTLRVQPSGNQYEVVVQGGAAKLSTAVTGQRTTTGFERTTEYIPINEKPVLNAQRFSVAENSPAGTVVGTLVATDPDGGLLTYSVTGGTGQGVFAVNPTSGQITVANSSRLDFETEPSFTLQVQVSDKGTPQLSASATITIELTNVDEVAPAAPKILRIS